MFDLSTFGINCFSKEEMKKRLPKKIYNKYLKTINHEDTIDENTANSIAKAMKDWALEHNVTHYCHLFQPLSNLTAEKHDSFISEKNGKPLLELSGKSLIKGEPDASSFPNGGLRSTFEARGYSYWDCSSPSFIKGNILYIPSIFISYNGDSLDYKLPLLNSINYISNQAKKVLELLGENVNFVTPVLGLEQEFFLIDLDDYLKRRDLQLCERTLIGDLPPKTQETQDHYFGVIPSRVQTYLNDVNKELWKLGIYAKTEHNEVAPCQFEICPIYCETNTAIDQNLQIMDTLKSIAYKHNLVCLLHEKPFKGINGSGKHNNYSLITNKGDNLFNPGKDPNSNIRFLLFVCAFIKGIDEYAPLIRLASSSYNNDYRLGDYEAPPGIVSIFLGKEIEEVLANLSFKNLDLNKNNNAKNFDFSTLSFLPKDNSDRNRTSPIAFSGNKFEFRMLGSSLNPSFLNSIINTIMGEALENISLTLSKDKKQDIENKVLEICKNIINQHQKILFNGNGYSKEWIKEAKTRGLPNISKFHEAITYLEDENVIKLLTKNNIYTLNGLKARISILYQQNNTKIHIEARTLIKMIEQDIIPSIAKEINIIKNIKTSEYLKNKTLYLSNIIDLFHNKCDEIKTKLSLYKNINDLKKQVVFLRENVIPLMEGIRTEIDTCEKTLSSSCYPYPTYEHIFLSLHDKSHFN